MKAKYDYDLIRDYLAGIVDSNTAMEMATLLKTDENARTIAEGILIMEKQFSGDEEQLDAYLENVRRKTLARAEAASGKAARQRWLKFAASVTILVMLGFAGKLIFSSQTADEFVSKEIATIYPAPVMRGSPKDDHQSSQAIAFYTSGNFKDASRLFESLANESAEPNHLFYAGVSHLYSGEYSKAAQYLNDPRLKRTLYEEQAEWHLVLAYFKSANTSEAKLRLGEIVAVKSHYKNSEAKRLLDLLSK